MKKAWILTVLFFTSVAILWIPSNSMAAISVRFTTSISGFIATFVSTVTGSVGAITYSWTFGDGGTSTVANPSHTYASGGEYQVSLLVTDTLGQYTAWSTIVIGYPSLIASATEGAGANCTNGGFKITYGLDNGDGGGTALDGTLQPGEVDTTIYVCNGTVGATGPQGPTGPSGPDSKIWILFSLIVTFGVMAAAFGLTRRL